MKTLDLAQEAVKTIESYKSNKIIMDFVRKEAIEKTAQDIRERNGSGTTAKAVELLEITNDQVKERVNHYITLGLIGCYMASIGNNA